VINARSAARRREACGQLPAFDDVARGGRPEAVEDVD
jgi:hypothetical protein